MTVTDLSPTRLQALIEESVEIFPGDAPILLVGEHAGSTVPEPWGDLGLPSRLFASHFGVDIGTRKLINQVANETGAPAVLARYSRIFLDYNRPKSSWDYCRPDLAGIPVPLNQSISPKEYALRRIIASHPLEAAIERGMKDAQILALIHSFTPVVNGEFRDVDIGLLFGEVTPLISEVGSFLAAQCWEHGLRFAYEKPYAYDPRHNETLKRHARDLGKPGFQIEVRNNLLEDDQTLDLVCRIVTALTKRFSGN